MWKNREKAYFNIITVTVGTLKINKFAKRINAESNKNLKASNNSDYSFSNN